jgi:hypothetical protein
MKNPQIDIRVEQALIDQFKRAAEASDLDWADLLRACMKAVVRHIQEGGALILPLRFAVPETGSAPYPATRTHILRVADRPCSYATPRKGDKP